MAKKNVAEKEALELRDAVAQAMLDRKGEQVISLDLSPIEGAICSYFVICSAQSTTQVEAIAGNIEEHVYKTLGQKPHRSDGYENALWIALDYIDVIAHVFQTETREFYRIEELWADAIEEPHADEPVKKAAPKKAVAKEEKKPAAKKSVSKAGVEKKQAAARKEAKEIERLEVEAAKKAAVKKAATKAKATAKRVAVKPAAKKATTMAKKSAVKKTAKK